MIRVTEQGKVIYLAEKKACRRFPKPASGDLEPVRFPSVRMTQRPL